MKDRKKGLARVPRHLSADSRDFYRKIVAGWDLGDDGQAILRAACEARDRMHQAKRLLDLEGITLQGTRGPRPHPAVAVERESRAAFLQALRQLNLDGAGGDARRSR